ncbi:MAG: sensor histidine kinase [Actinomadura sp.]
MGSLGAERGSSPRQRVPARVGSAFVLLMRIRMLTAAITLLFLPRDQLTVTSLLLLLAMAALSWLAARHWELIVPRLLAHPLLVALDLCVSFVVLGIGGTSGPFFLSTMVSAAVAGLLYRWPGMLAVSCLQIVFYYAAFAWAPAPPVVAADTFQSVLGQPIYYPLVGFAGVALRRLFDEQDAQDRARHRAEIVAAAAEERARLAREMHDSLAKTLRGIALSAAALPTWVRRDSGRAVAEGERIAAAIELASREARTLISGLRDDEVTRPLAEAVRDLVDRWRAERGIAVECQIDDRAELPLRARYEALAILSEVLANIERHAEAHTVSVRLAVEPADEPADVLLTVRDDGKGFELAEFDVLARAGHYGLVGLRERAQRAGGTVVVASRPGEGTTVTVRLPVEEPADLDLAEVS